MSEVRIVYSSLEDAVDWIISCHGQIAFRMNAGNHAAHNRRRGF